MSKIDAGKCLQCGVCCKLFFINLNEVEYKSGRFQTIFEDLDQVEDFSFAEDCGANFLAKKTDGSCVYLKNNCCSIHTDRPMVCREFYCKSDSERFVEMRRIVADYKCSDVNILKVQKNA